MRFLHRGQVLLISTTIPLTTTVASFPVRAQVTNIVNTATAGGSPGGPNAPFAQGIRSNPAVIVADTPNLRLTKTGDRQATEPGETIVYRLLFVNEGSGAALLTAVSDTLPLGINLKERSLQAFVRRAGGQRFPVEFSSVTTNGRTFTANLGNGLRLESRDALDVIYAAEVTPDALRGNGRNTAVGILPGNQRTNTANHQLRIRPGIMSDCGTLLGRVFVDGNKDGEQQPGEKGIPNAVVYLDDGNRVTADENGLFSVGCFLPGYRNGTLDLSSIPGYRLTRNEKFIERNSQSRMVRLAPGTTVRMNFGVEPYEVEKEVIIERPVSRPAPEPEPEPAPAPKPAPRPRPVPALF